MGGGRGSFVLVLGGSREARANLLLAVEQGADASGWETLRLRAHPLDQMVPYGALQPWLSRWYHPERDASSGTSPGSATAAASSRSFAMPLVGLIAGLPERSSHAGDHHVVGPGHAGERVEEVHHFSPAELRAELVDLVQGRTRQNPAVVVIEDADYLDEASRDWFSFLALRLNDTPLTVAIAIEGEAEETDFWRQNLADAPAAWCPLPLDPVGASGEERLRGRLRSLPARTLEALSLVVVAGPDAERVTVKEVLGTTDQELNLALSPAVDAGLLRLMGDRYDCPEPDLYPDLLGAIRSSDLVSTRRHLAQVLSKSPSSKQGKVLFRLSEHWAEAGEIGRGVPSLLAAAKEAERWGAPGLAEKRLLRAVVLSQADPTVKGREVEEKVYAEIAVLRLRANHPAEAREAFQRALALSKERGARALQWARYVSGLADAESRLGGHPDELLKTTLTQVQGRSNELEALLLRSLSFYYLERARFDEAISTAERACELADKGRESVLKVRCHNSAASAYIFSGLEPDRARAHLLKALDERPHLEGTVDQLLLVNAMDGLSLLECSLGKESEAIRWGEEGITMARRYGYGSSLLLVLGNTPEHYVHSRDFAKARARTSELRRLVERLGLTERDNIRQQLYLLEGRIAAETNDVPTAKARFESMVSMSEKGGSRIFLSQALVNLVVLSARHHDLEAARRYYRRLEREGLVRTLMGENRRLLEEVEPLLHVESEGPRAG